ncbi:hypothetical protein G3N94_06215 [Burkholderia sp. Ac-20353]|nr:hypothetical protein [Burkholderia sp. Ac-20353]
MQQGFDRIHLDAGENRRETIHVPQRQLQYWSTSYQRWVTEAAGRNVFVGASSRDIRLTGSIAEN